MNEIAWLRHECIRLEKELEEAKTEIENLKNIIKELDSDYGQED